MKIKKKDRSWKVGEKKTINITEKIKIELDDNEQASFVEKNGNYSYEVCKKNWGYYLSPSINKRMKDYNHKIYLTKDESNKIFIMAVKSKKIQSFILYCKSENLKYKILKYK